MRGGTGPTEPIECGNGKVAVVLEAQECCEGGARWLVEVVRMLGATVWDVKKESIKKSTVVAGTV